MTDRVTRSMKNNKSINYLELLSSLDDEDFDDSEWEIDSEESLLNKDSKNKFNLDDKNWDSELKEVVQEKINSLNKIDKSSSEYYKNNEYLENIFKIPFNTNKDFTTNGKSPHEFLKKSSNVMDENIFGHKKSKIEILEIIAQWISNKKSINEPIGFYGPPGIGKTSLIRDGFAKIVDRPFGYISLGGATDSSYLDGHSFTYEGSRYGKIIEILIKSKCMNPIIYLDELDKISETSKGDEIVNMLIHLVDTSQNTTFQDKYFTGIDIDLSNVLFVFSFNDVSKVNPILLNRLKLIEMQDFSLKDKITISKNFLLPKILDNFNILKDDLLITDKTLEYLITENINENVSGMRKIKHLLNKIVSKINLLSLVECDSRSKKRKITKDKMGRMIISKKFIDYILTNDIIF